MKTTVKAVLVMFFAAAVHTASARLLEGHYQVTSLKLTRNGELVRGANNAALYMRVGDRRVRIVGAFRGIPFEHDLVIERTSRDTMMLCDAQNRSNKYKILVSGQYVTGRQSLSYDDGTREVMELLATIRKMRHDEVERLRGVVRF